MCLLGVTVFSFHQCILSRGIIALGYFFHANPNPNLEILHTGIKVPLHWYVGGNKSDHNYFCKIDKFHKNILSKATLSKANSSSSFGMQYNINFQWLHTIACVDYIQPEAPRSLYHSPGSKRLSITTQLHCGGHLGGRAWLPDTILEEDHPMTIPSKLGCNWATGSRQVGFYVNFP